MKVRMKSTAAGPGGVFVSGQVYDLPPALARQFLDAEGADLDAESIAPAPAPEAATAGPSETADLAAPEPRRPKPRGRRTSGRRRPPRPPEPPAEEPTR
ncbi:MAG TPA: hypothetical protein VMY35_14955 [Phycisphaerae bacterium]|nr:hypothetical protein [Phycisphaerae bacterium]